MMQRAARKRKAKRGLRCGTAPQHAGEVPSAEPTLLPQVWQPRQIKPVRRPSKVSLGQLRTGRASSMPLFLWPPSLSPGAEGVACEIEKNRLMSLAQEQEALAHENRWLYEEIAEARREARTAFAVQRAEAVAMQVEREELQQLAAEAQLLLELKISLSRTNQSRAGSKESLVVHQAEAILEHEHAAMRRRLQTAAPTLRPPRLVPGEFLNSPGPSTPSQVTPRIAQMESAMEASGSPRLVVRRPRRSSAQQSSGSCAPPCVST